VAVDESQLQLARIAELRQRSLIGRNASTREELDQAEATRKKVEAQLKATQASLEQADADYDTNILAAKANVGAARNAVRNAEIELGYCRMTAPMSGRITRVNIHEGNLVGDGTSSLLATIVKLDPIYAYTNLSEYDLLRLRGQSRSPGEPDAPEHPLPMELGLAIEVGYPHRGQVDYQDPGLDPGTGTIRLRGKFANPRGEILPGMFVRIRIPCGQHENALLVPERALGTDQSGQFLLIVGAGDIVERRTVKAGRRMGEMRVVEGKIGKEERVVVDGLLQARPKRKVAPKFETRRTVAVVEHAGVSDIRAESVSPLP
jgi:membrane fusion protein (multidrug efflux system)